VPPSSRIEAYVETLVESSPAEATAKAPVQMAAMRIPARPASLGRPSPVGA
jgi:hypothetical protein